MDERETEPVSDTQHVGENLDAATALIRADRRRLERRALKEARRAARAARGWDDRPICAETQVLVNGQPSTVSQLAKQQRSQD